MTPSAPRPFDVHQPEAPGPVVVEVPHAGLLVDDVSARFTRPPRRALEADADVAADLIFADVVIAGATLLVARPSRFVIDLNTPPRVPTPYEDKIPYGMREVRRRSVTGERWLESPPPRAEVERRLREIFEPYHAEIAARLDAAISHHGAAILVSAHTYPDTLFPGAADVVLGTRGGESAGPAVRDAVAEVARDHGLSLGLDAPFPGGHAPLRHARPAEGVQAIQIELARRLYCEDLVVPRPAEVARLRRFAHDLAAALARVACGARFRGSDALTPQRGNV